MLVAGGADVIIQKATTGQVDWAQTAVVGATGGFGGAAVAGRLGLSKARAVVASGASSGAVSGAAENPYQYAKQPGPHTVGGFAQAGGSGAVFGGLTGGAGGVAGQKIGSRIVGSLTHNPGAGTMAMGRSMDYRVEPYANHHDYGYYKAMPKLYAATSKGQNEALHVWINRKWIGYEMMQGNRLVDIGTPDLSLRPVGAPPVETKRLL